MKTRRRTRPQGAFFHLTNETVSSPEEFIGLPFLLHFGIPGRLVRASWSLVERLGGRLGLS